MAENTEKARGIRKSETPLSDSSTTSVALCLRGNSNSRPAKVSIYLLKNPLSAFPKSLTFFLAASGFFTASWNCCFTSP